MNKAEMRLEVVPLPVADVDVAKRFYVEGVGFELDHDVEPGNGMRVVQLTPPGSACSIVFGTVMGDPGACRVKNLHLVVDDIGAVRAALAGRGVQLSEIHDMGGARYCYFSDPDGNSWALQELARRGDSWLAEVSDAP